MQRLVAVIRLPFVLVALLLLEIAVLLLVAIGLTAPRDAVRMLLELIAEAFKSEPPSHKEAPALKDDEGLVSVMRLQEPTPPVPQPPPVPAPVPATPAAKSEPAPAQDAVMWKLPKVPLAPPRPAPPPATPVVAKGGARAIDATKAQAETLVRSRLPPVPFTTPRPAAPTEAPPQEPLAAFAPGAVDAIKQEVASAKAPPQPVKPKVDLKDADTQVAHSHRLKKLPTPEELAAAEEEVRALTRDVPALPKAPSLLGRVVTSVKSSFHLAPPRARTVTVSAQAYEAEDMRRRLVNQLYQCLLMHAPESLLTVRGLIGFESFCRAFPPIPDELADDPGKPYLVAVHPGISLHALLGAAQGDNLCGLDERELAEGLVKTEPYYIRCHAGDPNRGVAPRVVLAGLEPGTQALYAIEVLSLYVQYRSVLPEDDSHSIDALAVERFPVTLTKTGGRVALMSRSPDDASAAIGAAVRKSITQTTDLNVQ